MSLDAVHHVTAITGDARGNVDFYARVLGLRLVKKTVNHDAPEMYHLYYGDETGSPGSILTFFAIPGARPGRPGAGMVHRVGLGVSGPRAVDFWAERLVREGVDVAGDDTRIEFADPEGMGLAVSVEPRVTGLPAARAPDVPPAYALRGVVDLRAFARAPDRSSSVMSRLGFQPDPDRAGTLVRNGPVRSARWTWDPPPAERGAGSAGTVHHVAWSAPDEDHAAWAGRMREVGARPTGVIDRTYFRSIYFREPNGVLFEIATRGPGFAVDEDAARLGGSLALPAHLEPVRAALEEVLVPVGNPRDAGVAR
jgi:glyoxalase family protein